MASTLFRVLSPLQPTHGEAVVDLCAKTFGSYFDMRRSLATTRLLGSHYDWAASAVGMVAEKLVTHFGVWDYQMRVGRARLRCGGIGFVATHGDYRKQGLMARTIPHSLQRMRQCGYDMSVLFGICDFYHRFGYVRAWSEASWIVRLECLPAELPSVQPEKFDARPREDIAMLHNRESAMMTGSAVRPTYPNAFYCYRAALEAYLWRGGTGKAAGHVLVHVSGPRLVCLETTGDPDTALAVLATIARQRLLQEIQFDTLPYLSAMARRLRTLSCRYERSYVKDGSAMVRLINLGGALEKMRPELEARLRGSDLAGYQGELLLASGEEKAVLAIRKGRILLSAKGNTRNTIRAGHALAQLFIGTDEPHELCEAACVRLSGDAKRLLPILFPNQFPQLHLADRF